eukprot:5897256-Lingulodinium_polyedra.AAC.1
MTDARPAAAPEIALFWQALTSAARQRGRTQALFVQTDAFANTQFYALKAFVLLAVASIYHTVALAYLDSGVALASEARLTQLS